ncbi:MAG: hypothetical protein ABEJ73_04110 [Haloplanus sp.]
MSYRPGQCNIGRRQRRRRAALAGGGFLVAAVIVAAYLVGVIPRLLLASVFVPLAVAFEWAIQAYEAFCVRLALLGRYDFSGADDGDRGAVSAPGNQRADQLYALKISVVSVALAASVTAVIVLVLSSVAGTAGNP